MIMCNLQMGAHVLAQCTSYHQVSFISKRVFILIFELTAGVTRVRG